MSMLALKDENRRKQVRTTIVDVQKMKERRERIPMLTASDYASAQLADLADIPLLLVGDSLGITMLGYPTTTFVTLDEMIHHTRAVVRGTQKALVVADMPFFTYTSIEEAIQTARKLVQEGGAQAVKLEGGASVVPIVSRLVELGIAVMAHIGLTPQSMNQAGHSLTHEHAEQEAFQLQEDASLLEAAGAFAIVLQGVPASTAHEISQRLKIPTIGTASGRECDGQTQIWHNILGLSQQTLPDYSRLYANLTPIITKALQQYVVDVREGSFPPKDSASD